MRIAFVSGNRERLPDAVTPLGLLYLMANTPDRHDKILVDLCFEDDPDEALRTQLSEIKPDLIALGMRNIQNNDYSGIRDNLAYYDRLVRCARGASSAPIVVGGSGFSVMPGKLMGHLKPDYGISGEGERAFPKLVEALDRGGSGLDEIGSLYRLIDGGVVSNPPSPDFLDMNTLSMPNRSLVDPRYYLHYGIEAIQTKRGCPLRCDYCTYPVIEGKVGRVREPASVVDEMFKVLEEQPETGHFFIVDSVFNLPVRHAKNVCRELIRRKWHIPWTCYANPLGFDQEFADLAREAGCAGMEIGSDSGCDDVLKSLRKGFTVDHIRRLHDICLNAEIPDCHTFILGTRGETYEHTERTLEFMRDLDPFSAVIMVWVDDHEALEPELHAERRLLRERIEALLLENRNRHWAMPGLGVNFNERLFSRLRRKGLHGPLWQHVRGPIRAA